MIEPQIVMQDVRGRHNADLVVAQQRLTKTGAWKKQRIVVVLPAGASIPTKVALTHWNLAFPPNNGVVRIAAVGMEVGEAYSQTIAQILAHPELKEWEYLLTIEHDNMPEADGVLRLVERMEAHPEFACIGGLYFTKGEGGVAQIWGDPKDPASNYRPQVPEPGKLIECCGTGMGFNLWRLSMFKDPKLRQPWFKTLAGNQGCATQDLYAWQDFRKHGYRCAIDCDVRVGHYDVATDIVW